MPPLTEPVHLTESDSDSGGALASAEGWTSVESDFILADATQVTAMESLAAHVEQQTNVPTDGGCRQHTYHIFGCENKPDRNFRRVAGPASHERVERLVRSGGITISGRGIQRCRSIPYFHLRCVANSFVSLAFCSSQRRGLQNIICFYSWLLGVST